VCDLGICGSQTEAVNHHQSSFLHEPLRIVSTAQNLPLGITPDESGDDHEDEPGDGSVDPGRDVHDLTDLASLSRSICSLLSVIASVRVSVDLVKEDLCSVKLGEPRRFHDELLQEAPSSKTHNNSPSKPTDTPGKSLQKRQNPDPHTGSPSKRSNYQLLCGNAFKIQKREPSLELEFLQELRSCKYVVDVFRSESAADVNDGPILYLEPLVTANTLPTDSMVSLFPWACSYLLDMCLALQELRVRGIIHRDISPNNIMFSAVQKCWKLIDFDHAVRANDEGQYFTAGSPCGTKGFIAPELSYAALDQDDDDSSKENVKVANMELDNFPSKTLKNLCYSWKTDVFGLGASYCHCFGEDGLFFNMIDTFDENEKIREKALELSDKLEFGLCGEKMCNADPNARLELVESFQEALKLYSEMHDLLGRLPGYEGSSWDNYVV
jgi:hypothetical protein